MLKIFFTAKILSVRIFYPPLDHRFITKIIGVFEIAKTDHKPGGLGRPSETGVIKFAEGVVKLRPVNYFGKPV